MPKNSPTAPLKTNATATAKGEMRVFHWRKRESATAAPVPTRMPTMPPATQRTSASIRNCSWMLPRVAPRAMRTPISRVRSVTETSMMFMMPMPPTTRETEAIAASRRLSTFDAAS
jgi:hypothetical protein